jgi:hypothetical protein
MIKRLLSVVAAAIACLVFAAPSMAGFGFQSFENKFINKDGSVDLLAGSHPWEMVTSFALNQSKNGLGESVPAGDLKDTWVELPAGFIGDPTATAKCSQAEFHTPNPNVLSGGGLPSDSCPDNAEVGLVRVGEGLNGNEAFWVAMYNLVPPPGVPAELGLYAYGTPVVLTPSVRTGGDYGITVASSNASQALDINYLTVILWGVPGDSSHDELRGTCLAEEGGSIPECSHPFQGTVKPFVSLPTSCGGPLKTTIRADSWQNPGSLNGDGTPNLSDPAWASASFESQDDEAHPAGLVGCSRLDFSPSVSVAPESATTSSPTGLGVHIHLPQSENPVGLAEADVKKTVVRLPAGMSVDPAAANGLAPCAESEIALYSDAPADCPDASKVGTVRIKTPLLEAPLEGSVYVAQQEANPFGSLFALYVVAQGDGVLIKLAGKVEPDPTTGQLTTVFEDVPQQPFSELELTLFGGPRATLVTPSACGIYSASSSLLPYSAPPPPNNMEPGPFSPEAAADGAILASEPFSISSGCTSQFAPSLVAGTTNTRAGGFSPFTTTFSRSDQDQDFGEVTLRTPPGLLGLLSKVPLCGEPQAAEGACPAASRIGHVTVGAGAGPDPVFLPEAGRQEDPVYLTGPYRGAPFGLSIVDHAEAGPFNLGPVIVRAAISVDPHTAQVVVKSDPLPQIVKGIPLQLKTLNVTVDRAGFIFDPTNCEPLTVSSTLTSTQGAVASPTSPYQAHSCSTLPFKPKFTVSTQAKTSKTRGASLVVKVAAKGGPQPGGGEANIRKVDVELPKFLPARLTTLQKACTLAQFEANPAGCPAASDVGRATAHTPVLATPLTGPAYLVSHGAAGFPDLEVVLQGEGVTLVLDGGTQIKKSTTYSHFETVPDAPISSFELKLPEGPHSVLTAVGLPAKAHGNLCHTKLVMPTTITAQNGAVITQSTKIAVTGCPKPKPKRKKK